MASYRKLLKLTTIYTILMFANVLNARMIFEFCKTLDKCTVSTDKGVINLWPLVKGNKPVPRFKNIKDKSNSHLSYSWNPCTPWVLQTNINDTGNLNTCQEDTSICLTRSQKNDSYLHADIGNASTARFLFDATINKCNLVYDGNDIFQHSLVKIELICSTDEGRLEEFTSSGDETNHDDLNTYQTRLHSKYACPNSSSQLSAGSVLCIIFFSVLFVYLIGGVIYTKFSKGATGIEMIPNYLFWVNFFTLVQIGCMFTLFKVGNLCGAGSTAGYESI